MNANEKIVVSSFVADCTLDDYENGYTGSTTSCWTSKDIPVEGSFNSIQEALEAVCEANYFKYKADAWLDWFKEFGDTPGRFDFSTLVREDTTEADADDIEQWKKGERKLWACDITAYLIVRNERELTAEELNI